MARSDFFDREGVVSIWLGLKQPRRDSGADILRDLCGVEYYDLDFQDFIAVGEFEEAPVADILRLLSYSASFLGAGVRVAESRGIARAHWAVGQLDFAYDPARVYVPRAADPVFLGSFLYSTAEIAEPIAAPDPGRKAGPGS
jgi:hypothetical protein